MKKETKKRILQSFLLLSILGFIFSIYLVKNHYAQPSEGAICDVGGIISCSLVNTSVFSELLNVPVALLGALWFMVLFALSWKALRKDGVLITLLFGWNIFGLLFVIYFIIAELILRAFCPFCTVVHVIVAITFALSLLLYRAEKLSFKNPSLRRKSGPWVLGILILALLPFLIFNFPTGKPANYDSLAQCLTEKGVSMYSSFRCAFCARTKEDFGSSFQYINEIECHPQGKDSQTELCVAKEIRGTPTWILEPGGREQKRFAGYLTPEELAAFAGCGTAVR
ncbi:hypothetical protein HYS49_03975 [Candidatus Woesearchaeota archaeon]|nr:hypothetical protein [Candidatus Woesearchaeota archaeon]